MAQAYDFALDKIGMEIMSYQVCVPHKRHHNLSLCVLFCAPPTRILPLADLGGLHQLSQRSVSVTGFLLQGLTIAPPPVDRSRRSCVLREAVGSYAENQRITAVRRVYQRGCVNPMINIEQLWRDYSKYEEASEPSQGASVLRLHPLVVVLLKTNLPLPFTGDQRALGQKDD